MTAAAPLLERLQAVRKTGSATWSARCPAHEDRSPSLSITNAQGRVLVHCHAGCAAEDVVAALGLRLADLFAVTASREWMPPCPPRLATKREPDPALMRPWLEQFDAAIPIPGTVAGEYLQARGCAVPPADGDLRCVKRLPHPSGYTGPAMLALARDPVTQAPMTMHRTWIAPDGSKPVSPARLLAPGLPKAGSVVMLWPAEAVTHGLGVGEGLETALALAQAYKPAWAALDAGNLASLPLLAGIDTLVVAVDGDAAGRKAAQALAARWSSSAEVVLVDVGDGRDLADLARSAA
jgi:putative DNA primase/helicase